MLTGRTIKATIVLDPAEVKALTVPDSGKVFTVRLTVGGTVLDVPLNAKSARKVVSQVRGAEPGARVSVVMQGKLELVSPNATLKEAGMAVNVTVVEQPQTQAA
jgi:hypothetical protein